MATRKRASDKLKSEYGEVTFGNLIGAIRLSEDWSQSEMAERLELSGGAPLVSMYESGKRIPTPEKAAEIAQKLGRPEIRFIELVVKDRLRELGYKCDIKLTESA